MRPRVASYDTALRFCLPSVKTIQDWQNNTCHLLFKRFVAPSCCQRVDTDGRSSFRRNLPLLQKTGNLDPRTIIDRRKEAWAETQAFCLKLWGFMYLCRLLERMGNLEQFVFLKGPGNDLKADGKPNVAIARRHSNRGISNDANWIAIPNKC